MATFGSVDAFQKENILSCTLSPTTTRMTQTASATLPLIGDGKGIYRIQIVGNSGEGF